MCTSEKESENRGLLPDGALLCVWMDAGLVAYKLCDRDYDCESCPFDAAIHGRSAMRQQDAIRPALPPPRPEFRTDRVYHPKHTWVRPTQEGCLRVGIDAFAAHLAGRTLSVVLPPPGSHLLRGRIGFWLVDDLGPIPLRMPVSGLVLRTNSRLQLHPGLAIESPYDLGWLIEVGHEELHGRQDGLLTAEQIGQRSQAEAEALRRKAQRFVGQRPSLGVTFQDGGQPVTDLRELMGQQRYRRMISKLL